LVVEQSFLGIVLKCRQIAQIMQSLRLEAMRVQAFRKHLLSNDQIAERHIDFTTQHVD